MRPERPDPNTSRESASSGPELNLAPLSVDTPKLDLVTLHEILAGLDEWADGLRTESDEEVEAIEKIYHSPLPVALFHATTSENARLIMTEGLVPSSLQFEDREVVSLSDSIAYAKFCASQTQGVSPDELAVLEVTTQGLDRERAKSYLLLANPVLPDEPLHEVHYDEPISADWIHLLTPDEVAQIELEVA